MANVINDVVAIDGLLVFATEHTLRDGIFAHRLDRECLSEADLIEMAEDQFTLDF